MWKNRMRRRSDDDAEAPSTESLCYKAAAYCSGAEHCRSEVAEKVRQWGGTEEQVGLILAYLEQENYISEARYAAAFVRDKIRYQGWGRQKIRMALSQKNIEGDLIDDALAEFSEEEYMQVLKQLISKKSRTLQNEEEEAFNMKMLRFLAGRGFTYGEIQKALAEISEDDED